MRLLPFYSSSSLCLYGGCKEWLQYDSIINLCNTNDKNMSMEAQFIILFFLPLPFFPLFLIYCQKTPKRTIVPNIHNEQTISISYIISGLFILANFVIYCSYVLYIYGLRICTIWEFTVLSNTKLTQYILHPNKTKGSNIF